MRNVAGSRLHIGACMAAMLCLVAVTGCDDAFQSGAARAKEKAEKKLAEGDVHAALDAFEAALDGTEKAAEIHYRMGLIYDDKLKQPLSAIHHFQRYLEMAPTGAHAKDARNFIKEDELKIATTFGSGAMLSQEDAVRLKNDNLALRKQITELRAMPRYSQQKGGAGADAVQRPIPADARTYLVQQGDTLASISRRFFKTSERWKDIQDANFNALSGTVKLKPGMTLMIPQ